MQLTRVSCHSSFHWECISTYMHTHVRFVVWRCTLVISNVPWPNDWAKIFSVIRRMPVWDVPERRRRLKLLILSIHRRREKKSLRNPNHSSSKHYVCNVSTIRTRIQSSMSVSIQDWIKMKIPIRVDSNRPFVLSIWIELNWIELNWKTNRNEQTNGYHWNNNNKTKDKGTRNRTKMGPPLDWFFKGWTRQWRRRCTKVSRPIIEKHTTVIRYLK